MKTPKRAPSMAASKSASAKKMLGDLPPSSRVTRLTVSAACFTMILPTAALPVKAIVHVRMLDQRSAAGLSETGDDVDYARGQAAVSQILREFESSERSLLGRLE